MKGLLRPLRSGILCFLAFFTFTFTLSAQLTEFPGKRIRTFDDSPALQAQFSSFYVYAINAPQFNDFVKSSGNNIPFEFQLGNELDWTISMTPFDIREENYAVKVATENGIITLPKGENINFRGYTPDGGSVHLAIKEHFIYGFVESGDETYYIEPLTNFEKEAPQDLFVVYAESTVKKSSGGTCMAIETEAWKEKVWLEQQNQNEQQKSMGCYVVSVQLAADYAMVQKYGSVAAVTGQVLGVLGNVATNYDDEFNHQLIVVGGSPWVSACSTCDPWTSSTSASALLGSFAGWGNNGGFGTYGYDVAGLWTARNLAGSTVGIAYLSGICNSSRYHVCQDFSSNASLLRVLQAHEMGHNFSAYHDAPGAPYIMAPAVNGSSAWSGQSQSSINSYIQYKINQGNCFTNCGPPVLPPIANFTSDISNPICPGDVVNFVDQSSNNPDSWNWEFPGGTPATSNSQNPSVHYYQSGFYDVTLTVSNSAGSNTLTIPLYVQVMDIPTANFTFLTQLDKVDFTNLSLLGQDYLWEFGDGATSIEFSPTHTYTEDGVYFVTLTAYNNCGENDITIPVSIITPPTANFDADPKMGCKELTVRFNNKSTANVTKYTWFFPGGQPDVSHSENPTVVYTQADTFDVTLIVENTRFADTITFVDFILVKDVPETDFLDSINLDTAFFLNITTNYDSLFWDFGDSTTSDTIITDPFHVYDEDGEYEVMLISFNECGPDTLIRKININTIPVADFIATDTVGCGTLTTTFLNKSSSNADSLFWRFPGGNPATSMDTMPQVAYAGGGSYDVELILANENGRDTILKMAYIEIKDFPVAAFSNQTNGTEVTFTNNSAFAISYAWDFGDSDGSSEANPVHDYQTDGVYQVKLTAINDCGSSEATKTITIVTPPTADFSADGTAGCRPFTVRYNSLASANTTAYQWSFPGGNPATSTDANPVVTYNTSGEYDAALTVVNAAGTDTDSRAAFINVNSEPTADFSSAVDVFVASFTNLSDGADSYLWEFGDGNTSTAANPVHTYNADGVYTVRLHATNICGTTTFSQNVTITTAPLADFTADVTTGCAALTVQYNNLASANTSTYQWSFPGGTPASSTEPNPVVTYDAAGSYDVSLTATNAAGSNTNSKPGFIQVNTVPVAAFSAATNLTTVIFNNQSTQADDFLWDFGDGETSTDTNPTHIYPGDGTYLATLSATNECGTVSGEMIIEIVTPPFANFTTDNRSGCEPFDVLFENTSSSNATNFSWSFPGGNPTSSSAENPSVTYAAAGNYDVQLIVSNAAGADTLVFQDYIRVKTEPVATFNFDVNLGTVTFNNTSAGADDVEWSFGDGSTSTETNPVYTYAQDGDYTVTLVASNDCGTNETTHTISIATPPTADFSAIATAGCTPFTVQFENTSTDNATGFEWKFEGGNPQTSQMENPEVTFENAGTYDVTLIVSNSIGSDTILIEDYIEVKQSPVADFDVNIDLAVATFINTSLAGNSYLWNFGDGNTSTATAPVHTYSADGVYTVELSVTNDCGTITTTRNIAIATTRPVALFDVQNKFGCAPYSLTFNNQSSANTDEFVWLFPGGTPSTSTDANPQVTYATAGSYDVTLIAINTVGNDTLVQSGYITVGDIPVAGFSFNLNMATAAFTNNAAGANTFEWNFDDGSTDTSPDPVHTFPGNGVYNVQLVVANDCGRDTFISSVTVQGQLPQAAFEVDSRNVCAPDTVHYTDITTGNPTAWMWEFPGGTPATSTEQHPEVLYDTPGTYSVTLNVSNAFGTSNIMQTSYINVESAPIPDFDLTISDLTVNFENTSTGATTYSWDFGDGNTSNSVSPNHTYSASGAYDVTLAVTNSCGTFSITRVVMVSTTSTVRILDMALVKIYPNPNKGRFTLKLEGKPADDLLLTATNTLGQRVYFEKADFRSGSLDKVMDFSQLAKGMYILQIRSGNKLLNRKIMID